MIRMRKLLFVTCNRALVTNDKVRNHCHRTGKLWEQRDNSYNLNYKRPKHIPVFFRNLREYDSHHFVQGLEKCDRLSYIAKTSQR